MPLQGKWQGAHRVLLLLVYFSGRGLVKLGCLDKMLSEKNIRLLHVVLSNVAFQKQFVITLNKNITF
jgi:hypothetical protein